ncbi:MAG: hypothetical protein HFJ20_02595 [Clostridia bacterium]|nr:hypothetical protein [Clostridia bacterium]
MIDVELKKFIQNAKVISGRDKGKTLREKIKIEDKDKDNETYNIIIPEEVYSFNSSCFLGMFGESIKKLGEEKFREKYKFNCTDLINMNIEDGIRDALNDANTLR